MRSFVLSLILIFSTSAVADQAAKRRALRALDAAYDAVFKSQEAELDYQGIISLAQEITSMTEERALVCLHQGGGSYQLFDGREGKGISSRGMGLKACEFVLQASKKEMTCTYQGEGKYHLYDRRAKLPLSAAAQELRNCVASIEDSRSGFVCTHQEEGWYHLYDRSSGKTVSVSAMPYGECVRRIP